MRIVLDTNVLISAVFFGGLPGRILEGWRNGHLDLVMTADILQEYQRVGLILAEEYSGIDLGPFLSLLAIRGELVNAPALPEPVCVDPDDDKFLACAMAAGVSVIVSGDKDLLDKSGWQDIRVLRPRQFSDEFLPEL